MGQSAAQALDVGFLGTPDREEGGPLVPGFANEILLWFRELSSDYGFAGMHGPLVLYIHSEFELAHTEKGDA
jgi:hypothetical protein|tara:strand:+ start:10361 stop:10576 length:216 start_codon:yes stop_codon:yes gene_type:complete